MLKLLTLAVCALGVFFLGPKALAEFRLAHPNKNGSSAAPRSGTSDRAA